MNINIFEIKNTQVWKEIESTPNQTISITKVNPQKFIYKVTQSSGGILNDPKLLDTGFRKVLLFETNSSNPNLTEMITKNCKYLVYETRFGNVEVEISTTDTEPTIVTIRFKGKENSSETFSTPEDLSLRPREGFNLQQLTANIEAMLEETLPIGINAEELQTQIIENLNSLFRAT